MSNKFQFKVLTVNESDKGNTTAYMKVSQKIGLMNVEVAVGYSDVDKGTIAGQSFEMEIPANKRIVTREKGELIIDGKPTPAIWIGIESV